jgi:hypothetical protein
MLKRAQIDALGGEPRGSGQYIIRSGIAIKSCRASCPCNGDTFDRNARCH